MATKKQPKPMPKIMAAPDADAWVSGGGASSFGGLVAEPPRVPTEVQPPEPVAKAETPSEKTKKMTFVVSHSAYRALVMRKLDSGKSMQDMLEEAVLGYIGNSA